MVGGPELKMEEKLGVLMESPNGKYRKILFKDRPMEFVGIRGVFEVSFGV